MPLHDAEQDLSDDIRLAAPEERLKDGRMHDWLEQTYPGQLAAEKRSLRKSIKEEMDRLATKTDGKGGVEVRMHGKLVFAQANGENPCPTNCLTATLTTATHSLKGARSRSPRGSSDSWRNICSI